MTRIGIVLQARMGSTRLPGKVLKPMLGKPMVQWVIERLQTCRRANVLVAATTTLAQDQPLAELAQALGVPVFRGSENDVLDRYYQCNQTFQFDHIVRATGDNPFVDPEECDRLIALHLAEASDYSCAFPEFGSGLPRGVGVEVFTRAALERSWREGHQANHREHVDEYIQENPALFRIAVLKSPAHKRAPDVSLTVDTEADFQRAQRLYTICGNHAGQVRLEDVLATLKGES